MPAALSYIEKKGLYPTEWTEKEYSTLMSAQELERSFVMATVEDARILDANKSVASDIVAGKIDEREGRNRLRQFYDSIGYNASSDEQGSIKDLRSVQRMKATIDTNVALARGWKTVEDSKGSVTYPALELYRQKMAAAPRDWSSRWAEAYAEVGGEGASQSEWIALTSSPIWSALSRFNQPHPPFDYGSKMWVKRVALDKCVELGLIASPSSPEGKQQLTTIKDERMDSLNADVEMSLPLENTELIGQVDQALEGLASRVGDKVVMADVNGTRRYTSEDLGRVLTTPNKAEVPTLQREAAESWLTRPASLNSPETAEDYQHRGDMARAIERITPAPRGTVLSRGVSFESEDDYDAFITLVAARGLMAAADNIATAFIANENEAREYASQGEYQVLIKTDDAASMRPMAGLYEAIASASDIRVTRSLNEYLLPSNVTLEQVGLELVNGMTVLTMREP